ncbi:hypothetical protein GBA52_004959 [Prunus armeniaca]|nr:hypothetical protein GBA52_004959 [Prunus armeniaca]
MACKRLLAKFFQRLSWNCESLGTALIVQSLRELIRSQNPSMVFLGDFNELVWQHKKNGGTPWCNSRVRFSQGFY